MGPGWGREERSSPSSQPLPQPGTQEGHEVSPLAHACGGGLTPNRGDSPAQHPLPWAPGLPDPAQPGDKFRVKASPASDKADG